MAVRWSTPASKDLERICERIERDNPEAARRVARTIYDGCGTLQNFPIHTFADSVEFPVAGGFQITRKDCQATSECRGFASGETMILPLINSSR